eukprot:358811-Chlamydomonas_euryale.AAC.3
MCGCCQTGLTVSAGPLVPAGRGQNCHAWRQNDALFLWHMWHIDSPGPSCSKFQGSHASHVLPGRQAAKRVLASKPCQL